MKNTTVHKRVEALLLLLFLFIFLVLGIFQMLYSDESSFEFFLDDVKIGESKLMDFRYRLEGYDANWRYNTGSNIAYESLGTGKYQFIVQSKIHGDWIEVFSTYKTVFPQPFYLNPWLLVVIAFALVVSIYLILGAYISSCINTLFKSKRKKKKEESIDQTFVVVSGKEQERIDSSEVCYVSSHKNYIEIHRSDRSSVVRMKLCEFLDVVPDPIEYMQIRRSLIIRKDKVDKKLNKKAVINGEELIVGSTFKEAWAEVNL
ncbi:MAG: triple tyrosine motif-containing protein [Crocinitomicaceae bacterium]|nr:triple tyrosine motif-containing protein [Crocinitomicaceae bacterium]